jgi:hypothetical protein
MLTWPIDYQFHPYIPLNRPRYDEARLGRLATRRADELGPLSDVELVARDSAPNRPPAEFGPMYPASEVSEVFMGEAQVLV